MNDVSYPVSVVLLPKLLPAFGHSAVARSKVSADQSAAGPAVAVVIDTLRFTSTAAVALAHGARGVTVVSQIETARQVAAGLPTGTLLCGERRCVRIEGFHLGNSPSEYTSSTVADRELVFSTTNGTVAVEAARTADCLLLASLLNRNAVVQAIKAHMHTLDATSQTGREVLIVCAGTDGQVALEDVITAGAILADLERHDTCAQVAGDAAQLALDAWRSIEAGGDGAIQARLELALGGRNLIEAGFATDLEAVAKLDSLEVVPMSEDHGGQEYVRFRATLGFLIREGRMSV